MAILSLLKNFIERDNLKISFVMLGLKDHSTGGYYFNFKMAEALSVAGHEVDVIHFNTIPETLQGSRIPGSFHVLFRVLKNRPDLLVVSKSYSFMAFLRLLLPFTGIPVLYLVHHLEWHDRVEGVSGFRKKLVRWFLSSGKKIWVNSKSTSDDVVSLGLSEDRICVIPPGFERFSKQAEQRSENSPVRILCVGTVCSRKDQLTLVKACNLLKDRNFHLDILGDEKTDSAYSESVRKEAYALGDKVTFMGHLSTEELYAKYNSSDILANLSHWEGYGIAVAEALWAGLPVLAVDAGAVPELVTHGENGFLITAGDVTNCAEHLKELIDNKELRYKMSENASVRSKDLFTWSDTGREFVHLAEETASGKVRRNQPNQ